MKLLYVDIYCKNSTKLYKEPEISLDIVFICKEGVNAIRKKALCHDITYRFDLYSHYYLTTFIYFHRLIKEQIMWSILIILIHLGISFYSTYLFMLDWRVVKEFGFSFKIQSPKSGTSLDSSLYLTTVDLSRN